MLEELMQNLLGKTGGGGRQRSKGNPLLEGLLFATSQNLMNNDFKYEIFPRGVAGPFTEFIPDPIPINYYEVAREERVDPETSMLRKSGQTIRFL